MNLDTQIKQFLHIAGIRNTDADYSLQWCLMRCALTGEGIRCGLDKRAQSVLRSRNFGKMSERNREKLYKDFSNILNNLKITLDNNCQH